MGKIFCIIGKSSSGKDTIYKKLLAYHELHLKRIVLYTTRPIRFGEQEGIEYHFTTIDKLEKFKEEHKVIECCSYQTVYGEWHYFMAQDSQIDLEKYDYIVIGTLESYTKIRDYFGENKVLPIYIMLEDGERLGRALKREKKQKEPKYEEMCRRFLADSRDFSKEKLAYAGIDRSFYNGNLKDCLKEVVAYIRSFQQ